MKYFLRMEDDKLIEATDAEPVTVPGFEDVLLFSHRAAEPDGTLTEPAHFGVSEATTGALLGDLVYRSRVYATNAAAIVLRREGRARVNRTLVECLNKYGLINA